MEVLTSERLHWLCGNATAGAMQYLCGSRKVQGVASLNVDLDYFDHPKTQRLIGLLARGSEVLPIRLWAYCGKYHAESGRLDGYGPQEIESILQWRGKPGEAVDALVKVGYLEPTENGYKVHDWIEYQGHIHAYKVRGKKNAEIKHARIKAASSSASSTTTSIPASVHDPCSSRAGHTEHTGQGIAPAGIPPPAAEPEDSPAVAVLNSLPVAPEFREKIRLAFNAWSIDAGCAEIDPMTNKDFPIRALVDGMTEAERARVIPAIEFCRRAAKEFKSPHYAVNTIRGVISENQDQKPRKTRASGPMSGPIVSPGVSSSIIKPIKYGL